MTDTRPNIVFILADQLRPDFLSCYGMRAIATPHIDALAARGIRFDRRDSEHPPSAFPPHRNARSQDRRAR